jgi:hypothetical protein
LITVLKLSFILLCTSFSRQRSMFDNSMTIKKTGVRNKR